MTVEETPVFFPGGASCLAGIVTVPDRANGVSVLIPWGAGAYPSSARNRIRARLARNLASKGFHALRFDYEGVGESDGDFRVRTLEDSGEADIVAACSWLTERGLDRQIIVGNCFGAWSALLAAPSLPHLEGLAMINSPVRRDHTQKIAAERPLSWWIERARGLTLAKLRIPESRARYRRMATAKLASVSKLGRQQGSQYARRVRWLADRDIPLFVLYGDDVGFRPDFEEELSTGLATAFDDAGPLTRYLLLNEPLAGYPSLGVQQTVLDLVSGWVNDVADASLSSGGRMSGGEATSSRQQTTGET